MNLKMAPAGWAAKKAPQAGIEERPSDAERHGTDRAGVHTFHRDREVMTILFAQPPQRHLPATLHFISIDGSPVASANFSGHVRYNIA